MPSADAAAATSGDAGAPTAECPEMWQLDRYPVENGGDNKAEMSNGVLVLTAPHGFLNLTTLKPLRGDYDVRIRVTSFESIGPGAELRLSVVWPGESLREVAAVVAELPVGGPTAPPVYAIGSRADADVKMDRIPDFSLPVTLRVRRVGTTTTATAERGGTSTVLSIDTKARSDEAMLGLFVFPRGPGERGGATITLDDFTASDRTDDFQCDSIVRH